MAYLVLNPKTLEADITTIRNHIEHTGPVVFSEVTNRKITDEFTKYTCTYFIDPQHTFSGQGGYPDKMETQFSDLSAVLYTLEFRQKIAFFIANYCNKERYENPEILYVLEKPDMDSVATVVLCQSLDISEYPECISIGRINQIHEVDCWIQPSEWNPDFIQSYEVKWTNILGAAISDFKVPIETRVSIMEDFLITGKLAEQYRKSVETEWQLLKEATIETLSGITVVTTAARGVSGVIYKKAPFGIGFCQNFMDKGKKFTVMEFTNKYLNLADFFAHMNANFPEKSGTWGGNLASGIGGSPVPCELSKELVAAELAKFVL